MNSLTQWFISSTLKIKNKHFLCKKEDIYRRSSGLIFVRHVLSFDLINTVFKVLKTVKIKFFK